MCLSVADHPGDARREPGPCLPHMSRPQSGHNILNSLRSKQFEIQD